MSLEKCIFVQTHSDESDKALDFLTKNKVNFITFVDCSYDKPVLISPSSRYPYEGYQEISTYIPKSIRDRI